MLDMQADGDVHSSRLGGPPLTASPTADDIALGHCRSGEQCFGVILLKTYST